MNTITLAAALLGTAAILSASPQSAPRGETEIIDFIQTDLNADKALEGAEIRVQIENGIAVLTGRSHSLAQAERATARAIASENVRAVVNQVQVMPKSASDIASSARSALRAQRIFRADDVVVGVSGNRISLTGKVTNWDERDLAREIVSEVPGVVAIRNNLTVTFEGARKDPQIEEHLRFLIKDDPLYEGLDLTVSVKSGTVRLEGKVGSRGEMDRLVRRSYVIGVMDVGISELSIDSHLAMEGLADKDFSKKESLAAMSAALEADSRVDAKTIRTEMDENGVMTLKGSVRNIGESDAVETTARAIPGVLRVSNELKIVGGASKLAGMMGNFKAIPASRMKPLR